MTVSSATKCPLGENKGILILILIIISLNIIESSQVCSRRKTAPIQVTGLNGIKKHHCNCLQLVLTFVNYMRWCLQQLYLHGEGGNFAPNFWIFPNLLTEHANGTGAPRTLSAWQCSACISMELYLCHLSERDGESHKHILIF